jgi:hypothetical protein
MSFFVLKTLTLVGFLRHWLEREEIGNDFAKFADLVAREQLMGSCSKELKLWIKEQKPKTVDELIDSKLISRQNSSFNFVIISTVLVWQSRKCF